MNIWTGVIGHVGKASDDGRVIDELEASNLPLPLLGENKYSSMSVGMVSVITQLPGVSMVFAAGVTELEPGEYPVAISLSAAETAEIEDQLHMSGRIVAVSIDRSPTWSDAMIVVQENP